MKRRGGAFAAGLSGAAVPLLIVYPSAQADVAMEGTFTATQACPSYQSFRKSTNPGRIEVEPNNTYGVIAKNKPDATHYRIVVAGAEPEERWVSASCARGRVVSVSCRTHEFC